MTPEELTQRLKTALDEGLVMQVYRAASVSEIEVLEDLRLRGHAVLTLADVASLPTLELDRLAHQYLSHSKKMGAAVGLTLGAGGLLTVGPELGALLTAMVRLAQRLSLAYGQEYETFKGNLSLWQTLGEAFGVQVELEGTEADVVRNLPVPFFRGGVGDPFIQRIAQQVLLTVSWYFVRRFTRAIPLVGVGMSGLTNYRMFERIGRKMQRSFRQRHELLHLGTQPPATPTAFTMVTPA